jgi:capsid protein
MSQLAFATLPTDARFSVPASGLESSVKFGYDATEARGKRKTAPQYTTSEDQILDSSKRKKLTSNARDLARNFSIASWMIRRHLDYTTSFDFHCRTTDKAFNTQVELFVEKWSKRWNFDRAARHSRARFIRMAEIRRVIDGDIGFHKLTSGHLQGIESDRIANPAGQMASEEWIHGVRLDDGGRARAYAIWKRTKHGLKFESTIPSSRMELLGYFDRFDQVRGISPIAAALNPLRDVYENFDLALLKAKVSQYLAMIFYTDSTDGIGEHTYTGDESDDPPARNKYEVDFGKGPVKLELDPGDRAEFLDVNHPSSEFQQFTELVIQVALKALDIPFSFYNESFTNFFGSRAAWLHYQRSCKSKTADIEELLDELTYWRLTLAILDGELTLPRGMTLGDLWWEWVPTGMPWWDPAKEINGDLLAIGAGLDNPQRITKERGRGDWYDNVDRISEAIAYAQEKGVPLSFLPQTIELNVREDSDK